MQPLVSSSYIGLFWYSVFCLIPAISSSSGGTVLARHLLGIVPLALLKDVPKVKGIMHYQSPLIKAALRSPLTKAYKSMQR